jgi:hypothetical protein
MMMASAVITTLMICCSGSWSMGRDGTTVRESVKEKEEKIMLVLYFILFFGQSSKGVSK